MSHTAPPRPPAARPAVGRPERTPPRPPRRPGVSADRLRRLSAARVAVAAAVVLGAATGVVEVAPSLALLVAATTLAHVGVNLAALWTLGVRAVTASPLAGALLALDVVWIGVVLAATGAVFSQLTIALFLLLVAVTVLLGWRQGVTLGVAATLVLVGVAWLDANVLGSGATSGPFGAPLNLGGDGDDASHAQQTAFTIALAWLVLGFTAVFSRYNERDLRRSNQELAFLQRLTVDLERAVASGAVGEVLAAGVVEGLDGDRAVVWAPGGRGGLRVAAVAAAPPLPSQSTDAELRWTDHPLLVEAVRSGRPVVLTPADGRPAALRDTFGDDGWVVAAPLSVEGRVLGLLTVGRAQRILPGDPLVRVVATLTPGASMALENARLQTELHNLSVTDALTGLYNHRYFEQRLREETARGLRRLEEGDPEPLSLLMLDLDHFKTVNDRFGHLVGDDVLRRFSDLFSVVLRSSDVVCRYGGEEFAVILPETGREQALHVADRLREEIARTVFRTSDGRRLPRITVSVGATTARSGVGDAQALVRQADDALYAAKAAGRNQTVHHG